MKKVPVKLELGEFPKELRNYLKDAEIFDSSSSIDARTYYLKKDYGYSLKVASLGALKEEAERTAYFYHKGLAPKIVLYLQDKKDYLLTVKAIGQDCVDPMYLKQPEKSIYT